MAVAEAKRLLAEDVAGVVFNVPVFAFPNLSVLAADILGRPIAVHSPGEAGLPGMGGLLAAGGAIRQTGAFERRLWGPVDESPVREQLEAFVRAAGAKHTLRGQVYGELACAVAPSSLREQTPQEWE